MGEPESSKSEKEEEIVPEKAIVESEKDTDAKEDVAADENQLDEEKLKTPAEEAEEEEHKELEDTEAVKNVNKNAHNGAEDIVQDGSIVETDSKSKDSEDEKAKDASKADQGNVPDKIPGIFASDRDDENMDSDESEGDIDEKIEAHETPKSSEDVELTSGNKKEEEDEDDQNAEKTDEESKSVVSKDTKSEEPEMQNDKEDIAQEAEFVEEKSIDPINSPAAETNELRSDNEIEVKDSVENGSKDDIQSDSHEVDAVDAKMDESESKQTENQAEISPKRQLSWKKQPI